MNFPEAIPGSLRQWAWGGAIVALAMQLAVYFLTEIQFADSILIVVLLVGLPIVGIGQIPLIREALSERLPAYWSSILSLLGLGLITGLVGMREAGFAAIGLERISLVRLLSWGFGLTVVGLAVSFLFRSIETSLQLEESKIVRALLPKTTEEKGVFAVLSVAAGFGEEVAYRGYAIPVLTPATGVSGAVIITSLIFGLMHGYQGALGIVRTMTIGGILALGFLISGSLWPCILAHALVNIISGIAIPRYLMPTEGSISAEDVVRCEPQL